MSTHLSPAAGLATSALLAAALAVTTPAANAAAVPAATRSATTTTASHRPPGVQRLSASRLADLRSRQRAMLARPGPAPTLARSAAASGSQVQRLTVTTSDDTPLADPLGTRCLDASNQCSLRAAVQTANNRRTPVRIVLAEATYTLSTNQPLEVTNPAGTSIVGTGSAHTTISGTPTTGVFVEDQPAADTPGPTLYVTGLTVTGGHATAGGAFHLPGGLTGSALVLDAVAVTGNSSQQYGGALYAVNGADVYARDTSFTDNVAQDGGALDTENDIVDFDNVTLTGNHSPAGTSGQGGAWWSQYAVIRMKGGTVSGNTAGDTGQAGFGGGLLLLYDNVALSDVRLDHNHAAGQGGRGAVYTYYGQLQVTGGTISHNRADGSGGRGGGLFADDGSQVELHGVTMRGDVVDDAVTAAKGGGAIYAFGYTSGTSVLVDQRSVVSGANGSAVYAYANLGRVDVRVDHSRISGSSDASLNGFNGRGCGGALCVVADTSSATGLTLSHDVVEDNSSTQEGGPGAVSLYANAASSSRLHVLGSTFSGNIAAGGGYGGALGVYGSGNRTPAWVRTESDTFTGNLAGTAASAGRGGAISVEGLTTFADRGSVFTRNVARGDGGQGGAVYDDGQLTSRFDGSTFTRNAAGPGTAGGFGGAVSVNDQGGTTFTGVTLNRNHSATYGGGIYSDSVNQTLSVERSTISGNAVGNSLTPGQGGGIYVTSASTSVENSTITGNRAVSDSGGDPGQGGGLYTNGYATDLRYTTLTQNTASQGGAIFTNGAGATLLGSIVSANHTPAGAEQDCWTSGPAARSQSLGGNVLGQAGCVVATTAPDAITKKPGLGALKDHGGTTRTMALTATSPAVGLATYLCPDTDQRGRTRPATHCDAGAFELPTGKKHPHH